IQIHYGADFGMALALAQGSGHHELSNPNLVNRFLFAFDLLLGSFHLAPKIILPACIVAVLMIGSLADNIARKITVFFVIPMFLFWACFFSYDIRNIAFVLPFLSIVLGFGIQQIIVFIS